MQSVIKATRANYAALKHRPGPDRYRMDAYLRLASGERLDWTFWVKLPENRDRWRAAAMTRAMNRLFAMYPDRMYGHGEVTLAKKPGAGK